MTCDANSRVRVALPLMEASLQRPIRQLDPMLLTVPVHGIPCRFLYGPRL